MKTNRAFEIISQDKKDKSVIFAINVKNYEFFDDLGYKISVGDDYLGLKIIPYHKLSDVLAVEFRPGAQNQTFDNLAYISLDADQDDLEMTIAICHELIHNFEFELGRLDRETRRMRGVGALKKYDLDESRAVYNSLIAVAVLDCWREYKKIYKK